MSSGSGAGPLVPTFHGFVHNSMDGLVLFEACLSGKLHHVPRRPHDRERSTLIKSGSIFIYEENASGIKRWTDGVAWSPSRILGNFLIYRELEKPFPPGEKKRAMKRKRAALSGGEYPRRDSDGNENETGDFTTPLTPPTPTVAPEVKPEIPSNDQDKELERSLIGSLVDSYGFRPDGLVKKTMSISVNGISHHMVSYYKVDDVKNNVLPRPLTDPRLQNISVRPELYLKQNFRAPVEETEHYAIDGHMNAHPQMMYSSMASHGYGVRPGQYFGQQYPMYGLTSSAGNIYGGLTGTSWPTQQASTVASAYTTHPSYAGQYASYYKPNAGQVQTSHIKAEDQNSSALAYGGQYASAYGSGQRNGAPGTPGMMQSTYQTPMRQGSSTFGSMSAHGTHSQYGSAIGSPATNGQSHQVYGGTQSAHSLPAQQYAVRSPTQGYNMQVGSAPSSAVTQSPHPSLKSPVQQSQTSMDGQSHMHSTQVPYRAQSYAVSGTPQTNQATSDMSGLGISNGSSYATQQQHQPAYSGYGAPGQAFRPGGEVGSAVQPPTHYAQ